MPSKEGKRARVVPYLPGDTGAAHRPAPPPPLMSVTRSELKQPPLKSPFGWHEQLFYEQKEEATGGTGVPERSAVDYHTSDDEWKSRTPRSRAEADYDWALD